MGEVNFVAFGSSGPTASISGSAVDVADFLTIWMGNQENGISLAQRLGVDFCGSTSEEEEDE